MKSVSTVLDGEGNERTKAVLLTEGMEKQMLSAEYADRSRLEMLDTGDVVYYSQNARNELVDYRRIAQLSHEDGYYATGGNTSDERAYGVLSDLIENRINALRNRRVNRLVVQTDSRNPENTTSYDAQITYPPAMFLYDRGRETVACAELSDARLGDEIFVQAVNGVVTGIIFIRG